MARCRQSVFPGIRPVPARHNGFLSQPQLLGLPPKKGELRPPHPHRGHSMVSAARHARHPRDVTPRRIRAQQSQLRLDSGAVGAATAGYFFSGRCLYIATRRGTPMAKWVAWMVIIAITSCVPDKGVAMEATNSSQPSI